MIGCPVSARGAWAWTWPASAMTARCLLLRQGALVDHIAIYAKQDTMVTVGHVVQAVQRWQVEPKSMSTSSGWGRGSMTGWRNCSEEQQLTATVHAVNVAEAAPDRPTDQDAQGKTLRDHLWLQTAAWLRDEAPVFAADHEHCEDLAGELSSVKYAPDSSGRLVVESKDADEGQRLALAGSGRCARDHIFYAPAARPPMVARRGVTKQGILPASVTPYAPMPPTKGWT